MTLPRSPLKDDTTFGFLNRAHTASQLYNPALIANIDEDTMLAAILRELRRSHRFQFSVAFITTNAIALLKQQLLDYRGHGSIYTSTYLDFNDPGAFEELLGLPNVEVRVLDNGLDAFHSKGYVFEQAGATTAIVGSSNLTRGALLRNKEWNLRFSALPEGDIVHQLQAAISRLRAESIPLTQDWIRDYEARRVPKSTPEAEEPGLAPVPAHETIMPNNMQVEALAKIKGVADRGENRAVVVSATGTGKTILAALAARQFAPERLLFIVHREQILDKAITEFARVLGCASEELGKFVGNTRQLDRRHVFATVQSLSRPDTLSSIDPEDFDLVIVDEVHRAGADSYQRVFDHLKPQFLLGLTATPERTDGVNIYELFDYNVPYEIRLQEALEADMLAPFSYFGVHDYATVTGEKIEEADRLARLVTEERVAHVVKALETYGHPRNVRGLIFCSSKVEAYELSQLFNAERVNGHQLRTQALTSEDAMEEREAAVRRLEAGELDYLLTVDIFNEGIDIPCVNQIVMLRQTESSIVFTQQLGRGLRKAAGKDHLRVIDFIGNYKTNFLIPIALFGDKSLSKDRIRQRMLTARETGSIAGVSSVNFDEIARERVLASLSATKLDSTPRLKEAYQELAERLGRDPMRLDFVTADKVHPVIIATRGDTNYWSFQTTKLKLPPAPSDRQVGYLNLLDNEFLNGKRPHELILLRLLLDARRVSVADLQQALDRYAPHTDELRLDDATVTSLAQIFSLKWFTAQEKKKYRHNPLAAAVPGSTSTHFEIDPALLAEYESSEIFRAHVDDIIEAGLHLNRHDYKFSGTPVRGERYTRKDACRLFNWASNASGTMYGYAANKTCPLFITYHKDEEKAGATAYEDSFESPEVLHWLSKNDRTLAEKSIERDLAAGYYSVPIFVKRDDSEESSFQYIGTGTPRDAKETTRFAGTAKKRVVSMKFDLHYPLDPTTYDYFVTPAATAP